MNISFFLYILNSFLASVFNAQQHPQQHPQQHLQQHLQQRPQQHPHLQQHLQHAHNYVHVILFHEYNSTKPLL